MKFIDIHVHKHYEDNKSVLLINLFPTDADKINPARFYSIGLHPWYVNQETLTKDLGTIVQALSNSNVLAIGEAGLDKNIEVPYIDQLKAFEQQLDIAEKYKKPVIIHCVKAYDDILSIRKKSNQSIPWIIHWFNASEQIAVELVKKNCYLSFGKMLFKENSRAFRVFMNLSLNKVFFETDDTGISISQVYSKAAQVRNISLSALQKHIKNNFNNCFGNVL
ncbi:MAG: TatD family hydrolase [Bacteroidales bacterium]|nr:TatD family hydrolase [Bacteroidales bacterium]